MQRQIFYPFLKTGGTHADFQSSGILSRLVRSLVDWCEYWCNSYCCGTLFQSLWSNAIRTSCFVDLLFFVIISEHPLLIQYSSKVMYLVAGHRVCRPLVVKADWNEWFSSNRRLSYVHRIMGSPGGKHCKLLQRNAWRGAVSPLKSSVFGQRMPHFAVFLWEAEVTNVGALIVSFCGINVMKSIDKHSFLQKVDCEIYWMVSKYIVLT